MGPADLHRYKKLLLEKQQELSLAKPEAENRVPAAGGWEGDLRGLEIGCWQLVQTPYVPRLIRASASSIARKRRPSVSCRRICSSASASALAWSMARLTSEGCITRAQFPRDVARLCAD